MSTLRITVLKRTADVDLIEEYMGEEVKEDRLAAPKCDHFEDGQEFILDDLAKVPEGFCAWAWSDMYKEILSIATGGDMRPWVKYPGTAIACCTDGLNPVVFHIEPIEEPGPRRESE